MYRNSILALAVGLATLPALADGYDKIKPVTHKTTLAECSACHIAYPAGFLPASSWSELMNGLDDHFGEDASLDEAVQQDIEAYLVANASPQSSKMKRVSATYRPLQISALPWFVEEHSEEVSKAELAKAGSYANCVACHKQAEQGLFDDD